jgi:phytoene dehydrogenase-like protein
VLAALGVDVQFREISPDGFDRILLPGYEIAMPRGAERYHALLERDFPHERRGLDAFFSLLAAFHEAAAGWERVGEAYPRFFIEHARETFGGMLDGLVRDPLLKAVLAAQGGNYALPPGKASALVGLGNLDHYLGGAYFPVGGSGALRDALVRAVEARGGEIIARRPVAQILVRRGRVAGVRCADGAELQAPAVISNVDAAVTYGELLAPADVPPRMREKATRTRPSLGALNLFLGMPHAPAGMTDANIWHLASVDIDRAYAPVLAGQMPEEDAFFLSAPSLKDPSASGLHTLVLSTIVPYEPFARFRDTAPMRRGPEYEALKRRLTDRYLACVERYVPGAGAGSTVALLSTPLTQESYTGARRGGMYGPDHTPDQVGPFRFRVEGAIPGLYLTGASTFGAGVIASAMSGFWAGALATRGR